MKRYIYYLLIAPMVLSTAVFADDCNNPPGGTDLATAQASYQCAEESRIAADAKLNLAYKTLVGTLKDNAEQGVIQKTQIMAAQRAWLAFRDAECDFRISLNGGAHQWLAVNHSECLTELTVQRTSILQQYLQQARER